MAQRVPFTGNEKESLHVSLDLDPETTGTAWFGDAVSLRWALIHMIEETDRHARHADIVGELIDGTRGDHQCP
jgi:hypothetical protein